MAEREQSVVRLEMWLGFGVMGLAVAASVWGFYLGNSPWVVGTPATVVWRLPGMYGLGGHPVALRASPGR